MRVNLKYSLAMIYWFIFRPKTFGVKCVVENEGEILMIKNSYGGWKNWMFPGGGIDKNESAEIAAAREVLEETGVVINNLKKIGEYTSTKEFKHDAVVVFAGVAKIKTTKIDTKEIAEVGWFKPNDLPRISEYSKSILEMWLKQKNSAT